MGNPRLDDGDLRALLTTGRNRRDSDGSPIEELGFGADVWNGRPESPASLSVRCGGTSEWVGNSVVLDLPAGESKEVAELYGLDSMLKLLRVMTQAWDPDWAVVMPEVEATTESLEAPGYHYGWITYVPRSRRAAIPTDLQSVVEGPADGLFAILVSSIDQVTAAMLESVNP